jgi:hypothetical protein
MILKNTWEEYELNCSCPTLNTTIPLERHRRSHETLKSVLSDTKQIFNTDLPEYAPLTFILKVLSSYLSLNTELYE